MAYEKALENVKTNYQKRELLMGDQIPMSLFVEGRDFDYIKPLSDEFYSYRFLKYKNQWYDTAEFEYLPNSYWNGVQTQSAFSAVFVHIDTDDSGDHIAIVGYSHW